MPSSTFFNLPEAKREKLLSAARAEFSRTSYGETSINRIIREAGIPRGSFYMYFTDKEDLFLYLMRSYGERVEALLEALLEAHSGDPFAAALALFDHMQARWEEEQYQELFQIIRQNEQIRPNIFLCRGEEGVVARLRDKIDLSLLNLQEEQDLGYILLLLLSVTGGALMRAASGEAPAARTQLVHLFAILRRGAARKPAPTE